MDVKPQTTIDSPLMISVYILEMPGNWNIEHNLVQYENDALSQEMYKNRREGIC